ncbi:hypothetical protein EVAR_95436_1 [Eumeta japonica]|uniref:Uncharacterized protein n=1 Tax=Eumeta variegata TaxID=151549 RepID=A0A4C1VKZ1_EUMVA|nr:hypothetical protein EVAR_95436_1 [Eumeta japonica]
MRPCSYYKDPPRKEATIHNMSIERLKTGGCEVSARYVTAGGCGIAGKAEPLATAGGGCRPAPAHRSWP